MSNNDIKDFDLSLRGSLEESISGMKKLKEMTADNFVMKESVFKNTILPYIVSDTKDELVSMWIETVGNVFIPITVIDDRSGEKLFTVPSPKRPIKTNVKFNKDEMSAYEIIRTADQKRKSIPVMGDRYLEAHLQSRFKREGRDYSVVRQVNKILIRYGYPAILDVSNEESEEVSVSLQSVQGYDEL